MKWTEEAEDAVKKIPFFVRRKVKSRIEKEAGEKGKVTIGLAEVKETQQRFLSKMSSDIQGFQVEACFGESGCPNSTLSTRNLAVRIEALMKNEDLLGFLKKTVSEPLKYHHEFRVALADCPNACSQPQIKDIGIISATVPFVDEAPCTQCDICVTTCKENSLSFVKSALYPTIDLATCVSCGACIKNCPTGTLQSQKSGYRVLLGGKLGRHPQLARELPEIFSEKEVLSIVTSCVSYYKKYSTNGKRFSILISDLDLTQFLS